MNFNERCYSLLREVPKGKVTTYKEIAHALRSKAYRAVGNAMNHNPYAYAVPRGRVGGRNSNTSHLVPCHRVVGSDGSLVGFASGLKNKKKMLEAEGIEIHNGKIDLKKYLYKF